jgi:hypothetical protein
MVAPERGAGASYERYYWTPFWWAGLKAQGGGAAGGAGGCRWRGGADRAAVSVLGAQAPWRHAATPPPAFGPTRPHSPNDDMLTAFPSVWAPLLAGKYPAGVVGANPINCTQFGAAPPADGLPLVGGWVSLCNHPDFEPLFAQVPGLRDFLAFTPCFRGSDKDADGPDRGSFWSWALAACGNGRVADAVFKASNIPTEIRFNLFDGELVREQPLPFGDLQYVEYDATYFSVYNMSARKIDLFASVPTTRSGATAAGGARAARVLLLVGCLALWILLA